MSLIHPECMYNTINIIMVSYYRPNDLQLSIDSVLANTHIPFHLFIIDNSNNNLNNLLSSYEYDSRITLIYNEKNIGKAASINLHYDQIMSKNYSNYVVTIDGDIIVHKNWLERFIEASMKLDNWAILAPTIMNHKGHWFKKQYPNLYMHNTKRLLHFSEEIFYNRYTAGPLLFLNRQFFDKHKYNDSHLYGFDDGLLCKQAFLEDKFIGILSNVHVIHSRQDENAGYIKWKTNYVNNKSKHFNGYWS